jgi:hypothetical protein
MAGLGVQLDQIKNLVASKSGGSRRRIRHRQRGGLSDNAVNNAAATIAKALGESAPTSGGGRSRRRSRRRSGKSRRRATRSYSGKRKRSSGRRSHRRKRMSGGLPLV